MVDRVSASITIGGTISFSLWQALSAAIASEAPSADLDGEPFTGGGLIEGQPLCLYAHEVANGTFKELEPICQAHGLPFVRSSYGSTGQWGPEKVVFTGTGDPTIFPCSEDGTAYVDRAKVAALGSLAAVNAYLGEADFPVPPIVITNKVGDPRRRAPDHAQLDRALQRCRAPSPAPPTYRPTQWRISMSLANATAGRPEREIIPRLNDRCRHGLDRTKRIVVTRPCLGTLAENTMSELVAQAPILAEVRKFTYPEGDKSQRDRGQIECKGTTVYFQIDAYDADLKWVSPDTTNASVARRVMTITVREDL